MGRAAAAILKGGQVIRRPPLILDEGQVEALYAVRNQKRITNWPYFSVVRFLATRTEDQAGGPYTWTIPRGTRVKAFGYGEGDSMTPAGFGAFDPRATFAETNIITKAETISGQDVMIWGVGFAPQAGAFHRESEGGALTYRPLDYDLLTAVNANVSWQVQFSGGEQGYQLGRLSMVPAGGGLRGGAQQLVHDNGLAGDQISSPYPTNGVATYPNRFPLPDGVLWRHKGQQDSTMLICGIVQNEIQIVSGGSPENRPAGVDKAENNDPALVATAQAEHNLPTVLVCDIMVAFDCEVVGPRSDIT